MTSYPHNSPLALQHDRQAGGSHGTPAPASPTAAGTRSQIEPHSTTKTKLLGIPSSRDAEKSPLSPNLGDVARAGKDAAEDAAEGLYELLHWDELAPWQRNNAYILTGHRRASPSHLASLRSIWRWHNETVNIWAHIFGSLIFTIAGVLFWLKYGGREEVGQNDVRAVLIYFGGCVVCFAVSSV